MTPQDPVVATDEIPLVRGRPKILKDEPHTLCPGCGESVAGRVIGEVIEEMGLAERTILSLGVGCYLQLTRLLDIDFQQALHGRAPAMATGIKRVRPNALVFTVQGDGDLHSEGITEAVQAATRGENITIICFNNTVNGETGGHMTAATVVGQKTKTTFGGRERQGQGQPVRMAELLGSIEGTVYSARTSVNKPSEIQKAKNHLRKAFESQMAGQGLSYVEILTMCPTGWFMEPGEAIDHIDDVITKVHPLGVFKDGVAD
ncbi:MAG TPA: thiamine pyrophosphate-dependent enzyme [Dehalococcoidia bacterium]|nr:thiamine pyrophosphate-dependent enzyme [Dehalococcoidia bacterium]